MSWFSHFKAKENHMNEHKIIQVPSFKEVYTKTQTDGMIKTVCELKSIEDDKILAFGISRLPSQARYNKSLAKKISYAIAIRILFLKITKERTLVEDNIVDEENEQSAE